MIHIAAVIAFAFAVAFDAWSVSHGIWTWHLFALLGLLLWCLSGAWDYKRK